MNLGFGLYRHAVTPANLRFAKQAGADAIIVHMADYLHQDQPSILHGLDPNGWGVTARVNHPWEEAELQSLKNLIESHGLQWYAIENIDPGHWYDILLDGPKKAQQFELLENEIRLLGKVGIPVLTYNFSIAGVWGWRKSTEARGGAPSVEFDVDSIPDQQPIPNGMVWNIIYDPDAAPGHLLPVSDEELWKRLTQFLQRMIPVAQESNVQLALHPDDPPVERLRQTARLVNQPWKFQRVIDLVQSPSNGILFCTGSIQEMSEGDVYSSLREYVDQDKVFLVHLRNVRGKVPHYHEVFIDEGDIDMGRILRILKELNYQGVIIPDHTPEMESKAPWHAGMAFSMGFISGLVHR